MTEEAFNSGYSTFPPDEMGRDPQIWMSGYDYYYDALKNRIKKEPGYDTGGFLIPNTHTEEGLEVLKYYLRYHNIPVDGSSPFPSGIGGVAVFSTLFKNPGFSHSEDGRPILFTPATYGQHSMTIVGYDDGIAKDFDIEYDTDDPGHLQRILPPSNYEWDFETNAWSTTQKPMSEWEVGAIKVVNSWGTDSPFPETGYFYVPYRFMNTMQNFVGINVETDIILKMTYKVRLQHHNRTGAISKLGLSADPNSEYDDIEVAIKDFHAFTSKKGGNYPLRGNECYEPIEYCLEVPESFLTKKYFFIVEDDVINDLDPLVVPEGFVPKILDFELIDKRYKEFHIECDEHNVEILDNGRTALSIIYDIIRADITNDVILNHNIGIAPSGTLTQLFIDDGKNLTLEDGTKLYFSNSGFSINSGNLRTTVRAEGNVRFIGYGVDEDNKFMILNNDELLIDGILTVTGTTLQFDSQSIMTLTENSELKIGTGAELFFTSTTILNQGLGSKITVDNNGLLNMYSNTVLEIDAGSEMQILEGSNITFGTGSCIIVKSGSTLRLAEDITIPAGSKIALESGANLVIENDVNVVGDLQVLSSANILITENSSLSLGGGYDYTLNSSALVNLGVNSKLAIIGTSTLYIDGNVTINTQTGSEIVVGANCHLIVNDNTEEIVTFTTNSGNWKGITCEVGSNLQLNRAKIKSALTAIKGAPSTCTVSNSIFENCENGIALVSCDNYSIIFNKFTGRNTGTGVSLTSSDGEFKFNTIENFAYGAGFILSAPVVTKNKIRNNIHFGILISGHNALPLLGPGSRIGDLNNEIIYNGTEAAPSPFPPVFPDAQIGIKPFGNVYLTDGMNNIYSGELNVTPQIPCISVSKLTPDIHPVLLPVHISATKNYWGSWTVTDNFFALTRDYIIDALSDYATEPYFEGLPQHSYSSNEPPSPESTQLYNALMLEEKENYKACIIQYEHVIKKYVDSPEYYVALARLPYVYLKAGIDPETLINTYDEGLLSENTSQKKFFKEMKIATHIKGKRYDTAITLAEEMKAEAQSEEEIILCDIDIAICNMMIEAENEGKGRSTSGSLAVNELINKLTGNEVKSEPASITENIIPSTTMLYQNYPNPFNPVTQIKFAIVQTTNVKLSIYNISGQKVAELANGLKQTGVHTVDFDGSRLNSGIYYYTLEVEGKSYTQKMILMK